MPRRRKGSVVISGDQPLHSPTGRRDMGVGCQGLRQTRAAVGGGIAHQIHIKVLRGVAAEEPPHLAAEEPPFFFWCPSPQGAQAPRTSYAAGRDDHERHPCKTECLTQAEHQRPKPAESTRHLVHPRKGREGAGPGSRRGQCGPLEVAYDWVYPH